jgi:hypothetical protein
MAATKNVYAVIVFAIFIVLVCVLAMKLAQRASRRTDHKQIVGGVAARRPQRRGPAPESSEHIVVDSLNVVHWLGGSAAAVTPASITAMVDQTAPVLKRAHPGRVIYVLKDRESLFNSNETRELYRAAAVRNSVYLVIAEKYEVPPATAASALTSHHSARGRDDFFMSLLARRYKCAVVTADKLKDFDNFRSMIPPFHTMEFAFWREGVPLREYVKPDSRAYALLRRPATIHPATLFASLLPPGAGQSSAPKTHESA